MLNIKNPVFILFTGIILLAITNSPAQAQRHNGIGRVNQGNRPVRELSQPAVRPNSRPQTSIHPENNRPQTVSPGKPIQRPPNRDVAINHSNLSVTSVPNQEIGNNSPKPKPRANSNNPIRNDHTGLIHNGGNGNHTSGSNPAPRPRVNKPDAQNGRGRGAYGNNHRPPVTRPANSHWTHQPRQLTRADYRRAPLAYRYHYAGQRGRYSAYNPCWKYNFLPRYYSVINNFYYPYSTLYWGGLNYRYCSGVFYLPFGAGFRVVPPPLGIYIDILPLGYDIVYGFNSPYYYYNGTYYEDYNNSYRVIAPPVGAIVESIPDGYETITIDGETYYKVDNVQYKPVVQDNGEIWYQVIKVG